MHATDESSAPRSTAISRGPFADGPKYEAEQARATMTASAASPDGWLGAGSRIHPRALCLAAAIYGASVRGLAVAGFGVLRERAAMSTRTVFTGKRLAEMIDHAATAAMARRQEPLPSVSTPLAATARWRSARMSLRARHRCLITATVDYLGGSDIHEDQIERR
jgi:hypothetical protein